MDVNRPKRRVSWSWRGRSCDLLSKQPLKRQVKPQNQSSKELCPVPQAFKTSCTVLPDSVGVNPGGGEETAVHEYLSDVGEVVNNEGRKNQRGLLASVMKSRLSPSPVLNRIQCSRHVHRVLRC